MNLLIGELPVWLIYTHIECCEDRRSFRWTQKAIYDIVKKHCPDMFALQSRFQERFFLFDCHKDRFLFDTVACCMARCGAKCRGNDQLCDWDEERLPNSGILSVRCCFNTRGIQNWGGKWIVDFHDKSSENKSFYKKVATNGQILYCVDALLTGLLQLDGLKVVRHDSKRPMYFNWKACDMTQSFFKYSFANNKSFFDTSRQLCYSNGIIYHYDL